MATSKYPDELHDRATRLAVDARRDPAARPGAIARIAEQAGVDKEILRTGVRKAEDAAIPTEPADAGTRIRQAAPGAGPRLVRCGSVAAGISSTSTR